MWQLRLIIILIGVVFIAVVYLLSRQRGQHHRATQRNEPSLDASQMAAVPDDLVPLPAPVPVHSPGDEARKLILSLHVTSAEPGGFGGAQVLAALQSSGLQYGQYQVFHRLLNNHPQNSVFSVANLVEPGVLSPQDLPQQRVPGLTLFLVLPGPQDGVLACADMLATARALARLLGGTVRDDQRQPLTPQAAQQIRRRILEFQQPPAPPSA